MLIGVVVKTWIGSSDLSWGFNLQKQVEKDMKNPF